MANGNIATISEARETIDHLQRARIRAREEAAERQAKMETALWFGGARVATGLIDAMFPQFAGLKPVLEVGGGLWLLSRAFDPSEQKQGAMLGAGLALLIGPIDRVSTFIKDTVAKFKNK